MLSQIVEGRVVLTPTGQIAQTVWCNLSRHFPRVTLDAFVVMPDHIHGIIVLNGELQAEQAESQPAADRIAGTRPGSLAAIVQNFKSVSARRINQACGTPRRRVWQEDFYERIVRDEIELQRARRYIETNPSRWRC